MNDKEKRGGNFTKTEIDLLIDITLSYKNIVEHKTQSCEKIKTKRG